MIDAGPIGQRHIGKGAPALVVAVGLDRDLFPKGEVSGGVLGFLAEGLLLLRAVDPTEAEAFIMVPVQDFDGIAVEHGDDSSGEVSSEDDSWDEQGCQQQEWCPVRDQGRRKVTTNTHLVGHPRQIVRLSNAQRLREYR